MQIVQMLKRECKATSEIEYFFYIQEMQQAIDLARPIVEKMLKSFLEPEYISKIYDIPAAKIKLNKAINQLEKFGLEKPLIYSSPNFEPMRTLEFMSWFTWWEDYLASLNEVELSNLENAHNKGDDISLWRPSGTWKNYI